jgi:hypothetical protein
MINECRGVGGTNWEGKPTYSEKTRLSAILSTTYTTWPDLVSNLGPEGSQPFLEFVNQLSDYQILNDAAV